MGLVDIGRGLLGLVAPVTGVVATGRAAFAPALAAPITVAAHTWLAPVINGSIRPDLTFRVVPNPATEDRSWTVTAAQTIDVASIAGGIKQNLPAGTQLQWLDGEVPTGLDPIAHQLQVTVATPVTGGTDVPGFGTDHVKYLGMYESLGAPLVDLELFSSAIGEAPALILVWDGSEPADGITMATTRKGSARVGRGDMAFKENWSLLSVTARQDSDVRRRAEGLRILSGATELLIDQTHAFGGTFPLSAIDGIQIRRRFRLTGRTPLYQSHYVYGIGLANTVIYSRHQTRTFNPWLLSRIQAHNPDLNAPTDNNPLPLADVTKAMPQ